MAETNTFLNLCYTNVYEKKCPNCNNPSETISHLTKGCMKFRNLYSDGPNRNFRIIEEKLKRQTNGFAVHREKTVQPDVIMSDEEIVISNLFSDIRLMQKTKLAGSKTRKATGIHRGSSCTI